LSYKKSGYANYKKGQPFKPKGIYGIRSGYLKPTIDLIAPYRHPSHPETEYTKNLNQSLQRSQFRGPSPIFQKSYNYSTAPQKQIVEKGLTRKEVNELIEESMKETFKKFLETTGKSVVPDEVVEVVLDTSDKVAEKIEKVAGEFLHTKNKNSEIISTLNEIRQQQVKEIMAQSEKAQTLEGMQSVMSEVREINQKYFDQVDTLTKGSEPTQDTQSVDMSSLEQRLGYLKGGFADLIEQTHREKSEIDEDVKNLDSMSERVTSIKKQYEDLYYDATGFPASASPTQGPHVKKIDYDSEVGY